MNLFINTTPDIFGVQRRFLTDYQESVKDFLTNMLETGQDIDSPDFASIVLELKHNTRTAFYELKKFKEIISSNLLDVYPDYLHTWKDKFYKLVCMQLQGTLMLSIKDLRKKHPELFNFTSRDVCRQVTYFTDDPKNMKHIDFGPMVICALYVLNRRLYSLLCSCIRIMEQRTDDEVLQIYNQCQDEYRKHNSTMHVNLLKRSCNRLTENGRLTKAQYNQLSDSIFNEIKDEELRTIIEGHIGDPLKLIKTLHAKGYRESVMEQVFCAYTKLEELDRLYEQKEAPDQLNYNQKLIAFLTECVKDVQAASYSKDGESLIRSSNEWFYVYRIFVENGVKGLTQRKEFVEKLQDVPIKVTKLPTDPSSLNKIGQEFKARAYPNWAVPEGRASFKHERHLELGAVTLKALEKHKRLLN